MPSEEMTRFRAVQERLQQDRDHARTWAGSVAENSARNSPMPSCPRNENMTVDVDRLAFSCAQRLSESLRYRRGQWEVDGESVSPTAVRSAVRRILPDAVKGDRRDDLAGIVISSRTFRAAVNSGGVHRYQRALPGRERGLSESTQEALR